MLLNTNMHMLSLRRRKFIWWNIHSLATENYFLTVYRGLRELKYAWKTFTNMNLLFWRQRKRALKSAGKIQNVGI